MLLFVLVTLLVSSNCSPTETIVVGLVQESGNTANAFADLDLFWGLTLWQNDVNSRGGLLLNGTLYSVDVISANTLIPGLSEEAGAANATQQLINANASMIVGPATVLRAAAAAGVAETNGRLMFSPLAAPSIFESHPANVFSVLPSNAQTIQNVLQVVLLRGAKHFSIVFSLDSAQDGQAQFAYNYLVSVGATVDGMYNYSSFSGTVQKAVQDCYVAISKGAVDVVVVVGNGLYDYAAVAAALQVAKLRPSAAIYLASLFQDSVQVYVAFTKFELTDCSVNNADATNYWISYVDWDTNATTGVPGQHLGTTQQFYNNMLSLTLSPFVTFPQAAAAASGVMFEMAITNAGTTNNPVLVQTLKHMPLVDTFWGTIKFSPASTMNIARNTTLIQYSGLIANNIDDGSGLVYPAPWPWTNEVETKIISNDSGLASKYIAAIVVAVVGAICIVLIVGYFILRRQRVLALKALKSVEEGHKKNYKIEYKEITLKTLVGTGNFGQVYLGEYRGTDVGVKKLKNQKLSASELEQFNQEVATMVGLRHPNILLFMGACNIPPNISLVTEYMPRGSLYDIIHDKQYALTMEMKISFILDMIKGLQYIISAGMLHRDLKSPNLLVDKRWNLKISDFGLTCLKHDAKGQQQQQMSLLWTAPEVLLGGECTEKSDVYSAGIIIWELLARRQPFEELSASAVGPAVVSGRRPDIDKNWNGELVELMMECWDQTPKSRPSVVEIRQKLEVLSTNINQYGKEVEEENVKDSTAMWEWNPRIMMEALLIHNNLLCSLAKEHKGYSVKSEGDSFMLAFADPANAAMFCMQAQQSLLEASWPDKLLEHSSASEETSKDGELLYKGLRVRMGIHVGTPQMCPDTVTGRVDYFGTVVNQASRITGAAQGGQILLSENIVEMLRERKGAQLASYELNDLGAQTFKGLKQPITVFELVPLSLKGRNFSSSPNSAPHPFSPSSSFISDPNSSMTMTDVSLTDTSITSSSRARATHFPNSMEGWVINYDDIKIQDKVGMGSFGEVSHGYWRGQNVAVKQFIRQRVTDVALLELRAESGVLSKLRHHNIIQFLGICIKPPNLCLITEYLSRGDLAKILHNTAQALDWRTRINFAKDAANGMVYLHASGFLHRDLKSSNLLVDEKWTLKIGDFGFSRLTEGNKTMTQCGTVAWTAPEIFQGGIYSEKADVYAYGVILWELLTREKPWDGKLGMKIIFGVENGERLPLAPDPSGPKIGQDLYLALISKCWDARASSRPSFEEIVVQLQEVERKMFN